MRGLSRTSLLLRTALSALSVTVMAGCSAVDLQNSDSDGQNEFVAEIAKEDGLAQAYAIFKAKFEQEGEHLNHHFAFGMNPFTSDTLVTIDQNGNIPIHGQLVINYATGDVSGRLNGPKPGTEFAGRRFDVWFVQNLVGSVRPETAEQLGGTDSDKFLKVGSFAEGNADGIQSLNVNLGLSETDGVNFDFDSVVIVESGRPLPDGGIHASGLRTLFEKRYFREKNGKSLDNPAGPRSTAIETHDKLVQRGAHLFFNETFEGNGRTCGTCHRAEDNFTLSPAFIAQLPASDPLFVDIPELEDPNLLREGMIRENVDGLESPGTKFVMRSVSHTLGLASSLGQVATQKGLNNLPPQIGSFPTGPGPDHKTGWSADGAPGRGTLTEFAIGAIFQHFPKADTSTGTPAPTKRVKSGPDKSFRLPTHEELYALEAFQLFLGRQRAINTAQLTFNDASAERGKNFALGAGQCVNCHGEIVGNNFSNLDFNTNVEVLSAPFETSANMPMDGGFGTLTGFKPSLFPGDLPSGGEPGTIQTGFGNGQFNVPPLFEAADTGPWFHKNNFSGGIESAVGFYGTGQFQGSPATRFARPDLRASQTAIQDLGAYLRTINALTNLAQVHKRVKFVELNRQNNGGNHPILRITLEDLDDAIGVLSAPVGSAFVTSETTTRARTLLAEARAEIVNAMNGPDNQRAEPLAIAATRLSEAKNALRTQSENAVRDGMDF